MQQPLLIAVYLLGVVSFALLMYCTRSSFLKEERRYRIMEARLGKDFTDEFDNNSQRHAIVFVGEMIGFGIFAILAIMEM
jgi:hypothetical protein